MLGILKDILCAILSLPLLIADWIVALVNLLFVAIGAVLTFVLGILPDMPEPATAPDSQILRYANWLVPIADLIAGLALVSLLVLFFLGARVLLNWAKAL